MGDLSSSPNLFQQGEKEILPTQTMPNVSGKSLKITTLIFPKMGAI